MTAKKTTVTLPGGLAGLVHAAQQGSTKAPAAATAAGTKAGNRQPRRTPQEPSGQTDAPMTDDDYRRATAAGESRWQLFEQLARQYHRASGLSAVYIDDDLKRALARLRASGMGVSASAILSAIVRQFLIENADSVRDTIGRP